MGRVWAPQRPYHDARPDLRDLDVIAWEGRGPVSAVIRAVTGGSVTHVALVVRVRSSVQIVESREGPGGRMVLLSSQIPRDGVLVYRLRRQPNAHAREAAIDWLLGATGAGYSWAGALRFARRLGWPCRPPAEDRLHRGARICSELVSAGLRVAGVDLRPDLRDAETSPAEVVASPYLELLWRLLPVDTAAGAQ